MATQFGVLPWREDPETGLELLLITSRETRRWVIPRGNPMPRLTGRETATREAYEEAGIQGEIGEKAIGRYRYDKIRKAGEPVETEVIVYPMRVTRQLHDWPERGERASRWYDPRRAELAVDEPGLKTIIADFAASPHAFQPTEAVGMAGPRIARGNAMVNIIRAIMPREDRFFDMFARHAELMVIGADTMVAMFSGAEGVAESCKRIEEFESAADDVTRDVLVAVRRSFITPFDRSAITALTSAMDDAIDEMWQTAKAISLYEVERFEPQMLEMSRLAAEAARLIREGVPLLKNIGRNAQRLHEVTEQVVHLEGKADRLHEAGLKALYQAHMVQTPMTFIVGREIFQHVERVLDRMEDVADEIQGIVIDHA